MQFSLNLNNADDLELKSICNEIFKEYENTQVQENFLKLLETTRKREQEKLLKGCTLTEAEFMSFLFKAYKNLMG